MDDPLFRQELQLRLRPRQPIGKSLVQLCEELLRFQGLQQIGESMHPKGEDGVVAVIGDINQLHLLVHLPDAPGGLDAVGPLHVDVQQQDVVFLSRRQKSLPAGVGIRGEGKLFIVS